VSREGYAAQPRLLRTKKQTLEPPQIAFDHDAAIGGFVVLDQLNDVLDQDSGASAG
jgi:hypothetical protein